MIKAFLVNSTTYLTGKGGGDDLPGSNQGWGLLDLGQAFDGVPRMLLDQSQILERTGQVYLIHGHVADSSSQFRVTLAWTDAPGSPAANPVVNDLDLQVDVGGKTYLGNNFSGSFTATGGSADRHNNTESLWLPAGTTGDFVIRVIAANITGDGVPGNSNPLDQDFALVVYNAQGSGAGIDSPPSVTVTYPIGGERIISGSPVRIQWQSTAATAVTSQKVEFSADGGMSFQTLSVLDGAAHSLDWVAPQLPTTHARIRVTALTGKTLPVWSSSPGDFEIDIGPPDSTPPFVSLLTPANGDILGGGTQAPISWTESDNVGVVKRVIEMSADGGGTFQQIAVITGPGIGGTQTYSWQVPAGLSTTTGTVRISVYDGANNSAVAASPGKFQVWALPVITSADYISQKGGSAELILSGSGFRSGETQVYADDVPLKKISFPSKFDNGDGTYARLVSDDKKLNKRLPPGAFVAIVVKLARTGQVSPPFQFKR